MQNQQYQITAEIQRLGGRRGKNQCVIVVLKERLAEANHKSKQLKDSVGKEQISYINKRGK